MSAAEHVKAAEAGLRSAAFRMSAANAAAVIDQADPAVDHLLRMAEIEVRMAQVHARLAALAQRPNVTAVG